MPSNKNNKAWQEHVKRSESQESDSTEDYFKKVLEKEDAKMDQLEKMAEQSRLNYNDRIIEDFDAL